MRRGADKDSDRYRFPADFPQVQIHTRKKLLTRTRLLTAACTAATGAVRSGMAFPSTSPSSCIITRWEICWATGSRILSIVFVWKTGMATTLERYPTEKWVTFLPPTAVLSQTPASKRQNKSWWRLLWDSVTHHYNYSRETSRPKKKKKEKKTRCHRGSESNPNVTRVPRPLTNQRVRMSLPVCDWTLQVPICLNRNLPFPHRRGCQRSERFLNYVMDSHALKREIRVCRLRGVDSSGRSDKLKDLPGEAAEVHDRRSECNELIINLFSQL